MPTWKAYAKKDDITATKLDDLAAPDDNTDLNASATAHGLLPKLSNVVTEFLNGTGVFSVPAGGGATTALKTADETVNNSNVFQNDDHLKWTVAANEVWEFYMALKITTESTPAFKLQFTVPAGGALIGWTAGDIGLLVAYNTGLTERDLTASTFIAGGKADVWLVIWGQYIGGANAGTVQLQWAQNVANATDTIVRKNSFILAHKLG